MATTITRYATGATGASYTSPTAATGAPNGSSATTSTSGAVLTLTGFDFSAIPSNAAVSDVTLGFTFMQNETRNGYTHAAQAHVSGADVGTAASTTSEPTTLTDYTQSIGTLTRAQLTDATFEVQFTTTRTSGTRTWVTSVDSVWVEVTYSTVTNVNVGQNAETDATQTVTRKKSRTLGLAW